MAIETAFIYSTLSFQGLTLESSFYCTTVWYSIKIPGSQCLGTGMTPS
ncbi:MAG: hypothetical protein ACR5K5_04885 [Wolbachia sp.]